MTEPTYPRIITNGRLYRIEANRYSYHYTAMPFCNDIWQTRFPWLARYRLRKLTEKFRKLDEERTANWRPVDFGDL